MYKRATKLMYVALILVIPTLFTACGGAALDGESTPVGDSTDGLNVGRSATSANPKSSVASSTVSTINVSSSATVVSSSKATSSESYALGATSSQSPAVQESRPGLDILAPKTTKLTLYRLYENSVTLVWDESPDNVGISRYEITRNGKLIATAADSTFILTDKNLTPQTDYSYAITAFDLAGNESVASPALNVRTPGTTQSLQASSALSSSKSSAHNSSEKSSLDSSSSSVALSSKSSSSIKSSSSLSSGSSQNAASSNSSDSAQSASSTSSSTSSVKSAKLTWTHPNQRENGQFLELGEIGGYEIRYRKSTDTRYTYVVIKGNLVTEYTHADSIGTEFEIAVFDINGVYSSFVKVAQ